MDVAKLFAELVSSNINVSYLGMPLIGIGAALVCLGSLFWLRASRHKEYDAPEDTGELRSFVDDLEAANRPARSVRPRLDQIRDTRQY